VNAVHKHDIGASEDPDGTEPKSLAAAMRENQQWATASS
jgi:hypothetical protein